ncbi:lamin tail domain-containing protein [Patescibacteria group bacterium]|nr:lamin tail domain-containing protein [Patescibacteria group bacterium]
MKRHFFLFVILFLLFPFISSGESAPAVVINEIAWMGTGISANDEWIEMYNNTNNSINFDSWQLIAQDGTPKISLFGTIPANGFYLLERTNDDTVPGISADKIYTGALGNGGEDLKLYNSSGNLIDEADCSTKWLAGDNTTKQTMEKTPTGWQTSENPGGTPKAINENQELKDKPTEDIPLLTNQIAETNLTETIEYPSGIVFNEIMPNPDGPDERNEWIELYNENNFEVDISDWKIHDTEGKITNYIFPDETKIKPNGYIILTRPITKITLNNTKDGLVFMQPDRKIANEVNYQNAPKNQSYNKTSSGWPASNASLRSRSDAGWVWSEILTPNSKNIISTKSKIADEKTITPKNEELGKEKLLASLSQDNDKKSDFKNTFFIAIGVIIFSATTFYFSKKALIKIT